jgi:hypothetical protein
VLAEIEHGVRPALPAELLLIAQALGVEPAQLAPDAAQAGLKPAWA